MSQENPLIFLVDVIFDLYIAVLLLRFIMQQVRADFYNPISQFIVKITQVPVTAMRRFIPGFKGVDIATLFLVLILIFLKLIIIYTLKGVSINVVGLIIYSLYDLIQLIINVFIFALFLQALLSWVNPDPHNPVMGLLSSLTYPILKHVRRIVPPVSGLDLSTLFAIIGLMFLTKIIAYFFQAL